MKKIIIETLISSEKTVVVEDNKLTEILIQDKKKESKVSNVYRGIVKKVLKGINACFVDIGFEKLAYLQTSENIKCSDEVIVQVNKEEVGEKGAKLTREISISGRYLVYIPTNSKITLSKKIEDENEKKRLLGIVKELTDNNGYIIRTEAQNVSKEDLENDIKYLNKEYENILKEYKLGIGPKLLYKNIDKSSKYIKDNINDEVDEIIVNNKEKYNELKEILKSINKDYIKKLKLYENEDVFDLFNVNSQIKKALDKKVWLKSGGYLIIEKTEALTVIDVNTGKFTGNLELEETVYKTNIEACIEICRQLKLRDIGGIIIVDFIDMKNENKKQDIINKLEEGFKKDKRKTNVHKMTSLGLVEITRKREKEPIDKYYKSDLETKDIMSTDFLIDEIEKEIIRIINHTVYKDLSVILNTVYLQNIKNNFIDNIKNIENTYNVKLDLKDSKEISYDEFNIVYNT